jgi:TetR/AcrR family transcriptional regulator, tetracycline repressor protein
MDAAQSEDRPRLSRAAVVQRGLALADAEGLEAVTIRRLASELGVTPMALYWHFRSKEELLTGLADSVWAEIDVNVDPAADWADQIRSLLGSLVHVLRTHPSASRLLLEGEKRTGEAALIATEKALEILKRGGFDAKQASVIARSALFTGIMMVMSEPGYEPGVPVGEQAEHIRQYRVRLALLPPDRFPCVIEAAEPMTGDDDPDYHYQVGVDLFVGGVQALARSNAADKKPH